MLNNKAQKHISFKVFLVTILGICLPFLGTTQITSFPIAQLQKQQSLLPPTLVPFDCAPDFYYVTGDGNFYRYNALSIPGSEELISTFPFGLNALGYNPSDNFMYGFSTVDNHLIKIGQGGDYEDLGDLGLCTNQSDPTSTCLFVGAFTPSGSFYVKGDGTNVYEIDVNALTVQTHVITSNINFDPADWAYNVNDGKFYGVKSSFLYNYNPNTHTVSRVSIQNSFSAHAVFITNDNYLYAKYANGKIRKIDIANEEQIEITSASNSTSGGDGANCLFSTTLPFPVVNAIDDSYTVYPGYSQVHSVLDNDEFTNATVDFSTLEIHFNFQPQHGTVTVDNTNGTITYTPNPGFSGTDKLKYQICPQEGGGTDFCDIAWVCFNSSSFPTNQVTGYMCDGDDFTYQGHIFTEPGTYLVDENTPNQTVVTVYDAQSSSTDIYADLCEGDYYEYEGIPYTTNGTYGHVYTSYAGCDSVVLVHVNFYEIPPTPLPDTVVIAAGQTTTLDATVFGNHSYFWNTGATTPSIDVNPTMTETFWVSITQNSLGCNRIDSVVVVVIEDDFIEGNLEICQGQSTTLSVPFGDSYSWSTGESSASIEVMPPVSTNYSVTVTLNGQQYDDTVLVEVSPPEQVTIDATICHNESYTIGNSTYTSSGTYMETLTTDAGCDSTVTLNLTVSPLISTTLNEEICQGETFQVGNSFYSQTGNYTNILMAANGCDSTVNLNLTVLPAFTINLTESICEGENFQVGNNTYTTSGNYVNTFTAANGCDSTVNLNLTVLPAINTVLNEAICEGESFTVGNSVYNASGNYTDILTAANGCDSTINLSLTILLHADSTLNESICEGDSYSFGGNDYTESGTYTDILTAANGCDSIVTLELTVFATGPVTLNEEICDGESYTLGNSTYTESGTYMDVITNAGGCVSAVTLNLTVLPNSASSLSETICEGESYILGTSSYIETGTYEETFTAANGCDSVVTLNLTVLPNATTNLIETICANESFTIGTSTYNTTGDYTEVLMAANGCDSIINLNLTVLPTFETNLTETICANESFTVGNSTYNQSGNYTDILTAQNGCDSTVNLNLTVRPTFETNLTETICDGETFQVGNSIYNQTGNYTNVLTAQNGCDSTVNLNLTVLPTFETNLTETICTNESFSVGNSTYNQTGNYTDVLMAQNGCDSTVNLNLTVLDAYTTQLNETICSNESYTVGNSVYTMNGTSIDTLISMSGCDSIVTLNLTVLPTFETNLTESICEGEAFQVGNSIYNQTGNYTDVLMAQNGCDSTVNLNLTVLPTFETNLTEIICDDETFQVGNSIYNQTGNYTDVLTAQNGCDSTVNINLTVLPTFETNLTETICEGETFHVGNSSYNQTGNYTDILTAQNGCDSTVNLNLTVLPTFETNLTEIICDNETFQVGNSIYNQTGDYTDILTAQNGCDSTVNLNLTVLPTFETNLIESICNGETFQVGNSSYNQTGNYTDVLTAQNGCDSTVNLNLTVLPTFETNLTESICDGETFQVGNSIYNQTGNYTDVLTAQNGCDSTVNLNLTVLPTFETNLTEIICANESFTVGNSIYNQTGNYTDILTAQNGCDSTVSLNLTVLTTFETNLVESICDGETFQVGNSIYNQTGNYTDILTAQNGCDSTVNLNLTVLPTFETNLVESICDNETFQVGNSIYNQTGNYTDILTAQNGCDSTVNLNLTVLPTFETNLVESICEGETFQVGNSIYNQSGNYTDILTAQNGCDSTVNLNLTVLPHSFTTLNEIICDGESVEVGGMVFSTSGNYEVILGAANGCDSTITLNLTVLNNDFTELNEHICEGESYTVGNSVYTTSGSYVDTLTANNGCNSVVHLNLTVSPVYTTNLVEDICQGETFQVGNSFYDETGNYIKHLFSVDGCDSIVNLDLTVHATTLTDIEASICEGEFYAFNGNNYHQTGDYGAIYTTDLGCDSVVILHLHVQENIEIVMNESICEGAVFTVGEVDYSESGTYTETFTSTGGCDSLVTLNLTVHPHETTNLEAGICEGTVFEIGDETFDETGQYSVILTTENGCDSTVNLFLTVLSNPTETINAEICEGESYFFDNQNLTESGTYSMTFGVADGCDSTIILELLVLENEMTTLNETICEGEIFELGDSFFDETGTYTTTLPATNGCSNFVTLNLTVLPKSETQLVETICEGESILVGNNNYDTSGDFEIILTDANGCDSIVYLNLTVLESPITNLNETICEGEMFQIGNESYGETGNYEVVLTNTNGCDSLVILQLNVLTDEVTNLTESICAGEIYTLGDETFSETGQYSVEISIGDCSSIFNLNLTVLEVTETNLMENICTGETFQIGNESYGETGNYEIVLENENGCDSLIHLNLTVLENEMTTLNETICAGESYTLNGNVFTEAGQYAIEMTANNGCTNFVNLTLEVVEVMTENLTQQICEGETFSIGNMEFSETGNYQISLISEGGCDSLVNLNLTVATVLIENVNETICEGETVNVGGQIFEETGMYEINLTSAAGCDSLVNLNLQIEENPTPIISGATEICADETTILAVETNGNSSILWSTGETTSMIEISESGTYSVTTTTSNGCINEASWTVEMTTLPMPEILTQTQPSGCGAMDGLLEIGAGGATDLLYSIDGGMTWQNDGVFTNLGDGLYEIMLANASEICTQAYAETIEMLSSESIDIEEVALQLPTNCDNNNGSIAIETATNGTYIYSVDNGENWQTSNEFSDLSEGIYTILVSNADGSCETIYPENLEIEAIEIMALEAAEISPIACHDDENGQIEVTAAGGTGDLNYTWSTGQTGQMIDNLAAGEYNLTVTDANNCTETFAFSLDNPELFTVDILDNQEMKYCADEVATLAVSQPGLTMEWTNNAGFSSTEAILEVTEGGVYVVTATNTEGCVASDEVLVEFSEEAVEANFLLPAEGLIDKAIVVADISWPIPDRIEWDFDADKIELIRYEENQAIFTFPETGTFEISMTAFRGDCSVTLTKSITLFDNEDDLTNPENLQPGFTQILEFNMIPNPNDGNFGIRISFSQEDSATLFIFGEEGDLVEKTELAGSYFYGQSYSLSIAPGVYTAVLQRGTEVRHFNFVVY